MPDEERESKRIQRLDEENGLVSSKLQCSQLDDQASRPVDGLKGPSAMCMADESRDVVGDREFTWIGPDRAAMQKMVGDVTVQQADSPLDGIGAEGRPDAKSEKADLVINNQYLIDIKTRDMRLWNRDEACERGLERKEPSDPS